MIELKFIYSIEINTKNEAISNWSICEEFKNQACLILTSIPFDDYDKCIKKCTNFMKSNAKEIKKAGIKTKFLYAENPHLHCNESDIDFVDASGFDENSLAVMTLIDPKEDLVMMGSILVYGIENATENYKRLH